MINEIRTWLRNCPFIGDDDRFNINYLDASPICFSIEETPNSPVITTYLDGSTIREKNWVLASTQDYSPDSLQQLANSGFWENFSAWVEKQNKQRIFPQMDEGQIPRKIEISTTHYLYQADTNTARYQLQMKLTYFQKGER